MSLTSHLKSPDSPIGKFIRARCSDTKAITKVTNKKVRATDCLLPPTTVAPYPYQHVGMAMDYRIRYFFAPTPSYELVAWQGAHQLLISTSFPSVYRDVFDRPDSTSHAYEPVVIEEFFASLNRFIASQGFNERALADDDEASLARYCYVLGLFEEVYRSGRPAEELYSPSVRNSVRELLAIPHDDVIGDIVALARLFLQRCAHLLSKPAVLNPTFVGSSDVGGADADLIVDRCLLEIKTTKSMNLDAEWLRQLFGYLLLDYQDRYAIRAVGIYLARHGELVMWPVEDFLQRLTADSTVKLADLRAEFRELCRVGQRRNYSNAP